MSDLQAAEAKVGTLRIYMRSGNIITLPRVVELNWERKRQEKTLELTQGGPAGGERLLVQTIDLDQIEALTWEEGAA